MKMLAAGLELTERMAEELNAAMAGLPGEAFAVRSSSPEEDLSGTSFAGMYETVLGTRREALPAAIAKAYSSMLDFRVMEYKAQHGIGLEGSCISVIVQRQIASETSGVGFSSIRWTTATTRR